MEIMILRHKMRIVLANKKGGIGTRVLEDRNSIVYDIDTEDERRLMRNKDKVDKNSSNESMEDTDEKLKDNECVDVNNETENENIPDGGKSKFNALDDDKNKNTKQEYQIIIFEYKILNIQY